MGKVDWSRFCSTSSYHYQRLRIVLIRVCNKFHYHYCCHKKLLNMSIIKSLWTDSQQRQELLRLLRWVVVEYLMQLTYRGTLSHSNLLFRHPIFHWNLSSSLRSLPIHLLRHRYRFCSANWCSQLGSHRSTPRLHLWPHHWIHAMQPLLVPQDCKRICPLLHYGYWLDPHPLIDKLFERHPMKCLDFRGK